MKEVLTALDIENKAFARSIRGYDPFEVDEFLDSLAENIQDYAEKNNRLEQEKKLIEEQLNEYYNLKNSLQEALLMAQKSADDKVSAAKEKGEAIIAEARSKSEQILFEADTEREKIRREINQLRSVKNEIRGELKSILARFECLLTTDPEEAESKILESSD